MVGNDIIYRLSLLYTLRFVGCFRNPRRKRRIRGNQSSAIVPVLKRTPDLFAVSQNGNGNRNVVHICLTSEIHCIMPGAARQGARAGLSIGNYVRSQTSY